MAKVTVNETAPQPDKPGVKKSQNTLEFLLKDGRKLTIRKMGPMDRMRMCSIIGAENSKNELYLSHAIPAYCVATIDGDLIPRAQTVLSIESMAERLGDEGIVEIMMAMGEHFGAGDTSEVIKELSNREAIKNS